MTSLSRFITRLAERIKPILRVMKKNAQGVCSDQCEKAFEEVKEILTEPSVMGRPKPNHDLQVFLVATDKVISATMQAQE